MGAQYDSGPPSDNNTPNNSRQIPINCLGVSDQKGGALHQNFEM